MDTIDMDAICERCGEKYKDHHNPHNWCPIIKSGESQIGWRSATFKSKQMPSKEEREKILDKMVEQNQKDGLYDKIAILGSGEPIPLKSNLEILRRHCGHYVDIEFEKKILFAMIEFANVSISEWEKGTLEEIRPLIEEMRDALEDDLFNIDVSCAEFGKDPSSYPIYQKIKAVIAKADQFLNNHK